MAATTTCRLSPSIPIFNRNALFNTLEFSSLFLIEFVINSFLHDVTVSVGWIGSTFSPKLPTGSWLYIFLERERFKSLQMGAGVEFGSPCWVCYLRSEDAWARRICQR